MQAAALTDIPGSRSAFVGALIYRLLSAPSGHERPDRRFADEHDFAWATAAMVPTQSFAGDIPGTMPTVDEVDRIIRLTAESH
jgi:ribokinase